MRNKLISSIAGAAFSVAASGFAFAADLNRPVYKAPPPPPPAPVYTWTGWYVGGNVGYSWGDANTDLRGNGTVLTTVGSSFASEPLAFAASNTAHPNGVIGGGQIGYDYQFSSNGVVGFEADIQGSGERRSNQFVDSFIVPVCIEPTPTGCTPGIIDPLPAAAVTSYEAEIDWFGTVRGRLGLLVGDQLLIYGTGGLAYGRVSVSGSTNVSAMFFTPATAAFGASKTDVGFSVGGGIEGRLSYWLSPNWTWKLEYLYLDLGSLDTAASSFALVSTPFSSTATGTVTTHTHFTDNIVRVGLNYKFTN